MADQRWGCLRFGAFVLGVWAVGGAAAQAAEVTWTVRPGSQLTETTIMNAYPTADPMAVNVMTVAPQAPGSLVSPQTGTFKTTGNFLNSVDFGPMPIDNAVWNNHDTPTPTEAYAAIFAASATALGIVQGDTMSDVPPPGPLPVPGGGTPGSGGDPAHASTVPGVPATAPANFAWIATDPNYPGAPGTTVFLTASRGIRSSLWTDGTAPSVDLTTGNFAIGSAAGPGGGSTKSISTSTVDFNSVSLDGPLGFSNATYSGGAGAVPLPVLGNSASDNPMDQGTLSRDGAKYVMTIHYTDFANLAEDSTIPAFFPFTEERKVNIRSTFTTDTVAEANLRLGDVNFDGDVNIFDVNLISANWSGSNPAAFGNLTPGDANGDGVVDIFDINLVSANWGPAAGGVQSVSEPSTMVLSGLGILGILFVAIRRRRG
jgi:Dockerin type I domain/PEP-CTERM motif